VLRAFALLALAALALAPGCARKKRGPAYKIDALAAGPSGACGTMRDGSLTCWGDVPIVPVTERAMPARVLPAGAGASGACVAAGRVCTLVQGRVRCARAPETALSDVPGMDGVAQIACDRDLACGRTTDGRVLCWTTGAPAEVPGARGAKSIAVAAGSACAVIEDGTLRCWGENRDGTLGDGTTKASTAPVMPAILDAESVAMGDRHACAKLRNETLWCWGRNESGQLGDGTTTDRLVPKPVPGMVIVGAVAVGGAHTCARLMDSTVKCWGRNDRRQLGLASTEPFVPSPKTIPGLYEATAVAAGDAFTCGVMKDGWLRCWGANEAGQLADGSLLDRHVPTPIRYP
jgi:alpha-tubulin suppressor-like RCC1 family protein